MAVTSLKLPDQLKQRLAAIVSGTDRSAHAFMIDAIAQEVTRAEQRRDFLQDAMKAQAEVERTGRVYDADEVFTYLRARAQGKQTKRPRARVSKTWQRSS